MKRVTMTVLAICLALCVTGCIFTGDDGRTTTENTMADTTTTTTTAVQAAPRIDQTPRLLHVLPAVRA